MAKRPRDDSDDDSEDDRPRRRRRDDGVPPGTPRVYVHSKCGTQTEMPADVIRTYLDNPFHYGGQTTCARCDKDVPWERCEWVETGQNLLDYFEDLQAEALLRGDDPREHQEALFYWIGGPVGGALVLGFLGATIAAKSGASAVLGGLLGAVVGTLAMLGWAYNQSRGYEAEKDRYDRGLMKRYYQRHPEAKAKKGRRRADDE